MRRTTIAILALAGCTSAYDPAKYGTTRVAVTECIEPQQSWVPAELASLRALGPDWRLVADGEAPDVTVRCADTGPTGGAGQYFVGTSEVFVDPAKANGEFAFRQAVGHELFHWRIDHGPVPSRAPTHICWFARNDAPPPGCHPTIVAQHALMSPSVGGTEAEWTTEEVYTGDLAQYDPTDDDIQLFRWGLGEAP